MGVEPELVRLSNGVRLALDPMPALATAAIGVWLRVGARWETPEQNGVAHLFEHMAFKGAGSRDARALAEAIESVGGVMNAATSYERTAYYIRALGRDAAFALDLLADIVLAPHWAEADLEKEKGVVRQEMGEAFDQPDDRVFELHQAALFPGQALGRPILGAPAVLDAVKVSTLVDFRDAHYGAERVVIAVAGSFDRAALIDTAERRFGALKAANGFVAEEARPARAFGAEARRLEQTHLSFSWPGPAAGADALYAARLMAEIFGGGMASRLFQEVREKRGLVYAIDSYLETYEDVGRLGVYAGCAAKDASDVARATADILGELAVHGPTDAELTRAKAVTAAQMLMGAEAPLARAEARAGQVFLRDRLISFDDIQRRVEAVTVDQVRAVAADAAAGPAASAAIGPKAGLKAAETFLARFV